MPKQNLLLSESKSFVNIWHCQKIKTGKIHDIVEKS